MRSPLRLLGHPRLFSLWERLGLHVLPSHYYQPVPRPQDLREHEWTATRRLPGLRLETGGMLALLEEVGPTYVREFTDVCRAEGPESASIQHAYFGAVDGELLYAMVRRSRPRRVVEVGCGGSSMIIGLALRRTAQEVPGYECEHVMVDPYPPPVLARAQWTRQRVIERRVQRVGIAEMGALQAGDIFFIDSSHVVATAGDVEYLFREVIPALPVGVLVHLHDIFTPQDYPRHWVMQWRRFWTEQYLLESFLAFNYAFRVVWMGNLMRMRHPERLGEVIPRFDPASTVPGSLWMERVS